MIMQTRNLSYLSLAASMRYPRSSQSSRRTLSNSSAGRCRSVLEGHVQTPASSCLTREHNSFCA